MPERTIRRLHAELRATLVMQLQEAHFGYLTRIPIPRARSPPTNPLLLWFPSLTNHTTIHLDPQTGGDWGESTKLSGANASFYANSFLGHLGCSNKCFWLVLGLC